MKRISILIFTTIISMLTLSSCSSNNYDFQLFYTKYANDHISINDKLDNSQINNTSILNKQLEISKLEKKFKPLLDSQKTYSEMTDSEKETAKEIIANWNKLSMNFKSEYIKCKKKLKDSMNQNNSTYSADLNLETLKASYNTNITYNDLSRTPDDYIDKKITVTGTIMQITGAYSQNGIKIAIDNNINEPLFIDYDPSIIDVTLKPNSCIQIRGIFVEIVSDYSLIQGETKIPIIYANYIDIIE